MKTCIIGLLAETSLHPGTESSVGVIDLPVAREVSTGIPFLSGSGFKGAMRDKAWQRWPKVEDKEDPRIGEIFGLQNNAGAIAVTDARLLLLPVRSLTGHYKWVTCPYILERYIRDREMSGLPVSFKTPLPEKGKVVTQGEGQLYLEELSFDIINDDLSGIVDSLSLLIRHKSVRKRLSSQLAILNDDDFSYFTSYCLQVNARNFLNNETKKSENLWYEETIPPDSLFYALIIARSGKEKALDEMQWLFSEHPYIQVGGNETIGQGWCAVTWFSGKGDNGE